MGYKSNQTIMKHQPYKTEELQHEVHRLRMENEALRRSMSWRVTAPLRALGSVVKTPHQLKRLVQTLRHEGIQGTVRHVRRKLRGTEQERERVYAKLRPSLIAELHKFEDVKNGPKISLCVPVYNTNPEHLKELVESVEAQWYTNWELCLWDDGSMREDTKTYLETLKGKANIVLGGSKKNRHISAAQNAAIGLATGEFIALVDHDDVLEPASLSCMVWHMQKHPEADLLYSDEDKLTEDGTGYMFPHLKPSWNKELLLNYNYINHLALIRKSVGDQVGWFREGFEGAQDYDLYLRISEQTKHIIHVPYILYHWRMVKGSTADLIGAKPYVLQAARRALAEHMERLGVKAKVIDGHAPSIYEVERELSRTPQVTIMIPFRDKPELLERAMASLEKYTSYPEYEVLLINNGSVEPATMRLLDRLKKKQWVRVLDLPIPFNYPKLNNEGAKVAKGEYLLLLNNDIECTTKGWLTHLVAHLEDIEIGVVGAKLYYPDGSLQHGGVITSIGGVAGHSHKGLPRGEYGYMHRTHVSQELSAVTGACMLVRKREYLEIGGMNEQELQVAFNDVDFCLRMRKNGKKVIYEPRASMVHHESKTRGYEDTPEKQKRFKKEIEYMFRTWPEECRADPFYHRLLTKDHEDFSFQT